MAALTWTAGQAKISAKPLHAEDERGHWSPQGASRDATFRHKGASREATSCHKGPSREATSCHKGPRESREMPLVASRVSRGTFQLFLLDRSSVLPLQCMTPVPGHALVPPVPRSTRSPGRSSRRGTRRGLSEIRTSSPRIATSRYPPLNWGQHEERSTMTVKLGALSAGGFGQESASHCA